MRHTGIVQVLEPARDTCRNDHLDRREGSETMKQYRYLPWYGYLAALFIALGALAVAYGLYTSIMTVARIIEAALGAIQ